MASPKFAGAIDSRCGTAWCIASAPTDALLKSRRVFHRPTMPSSPETTGGAGTTYETQVATCYMAALLVGGEAFGLEAAFAESVAVQRKEFGDPLDDVVVIARRSDGTNARLQLQAKRSLRVSDGASNTDFREVVRACFELLGSQAFQFGVDRFGAATEHITDTTYRYTRKLSQVARTSANEEEFKRQTSVPGTLGASTIKVFEDVQSVLRDVAEREPTDRELWDFWRHFLMLRIETTGEGATHRAIAIGQIGYALVPEQRDQATNVFDALEAIARQSNANAGALSRSTLVDRLTGRFRYRDEIASDSLEAVAVRARAASASDLLGFRRAQGKLLGVANLALLELDQKDEWQQISQTELVSRLRRGTSFILEGAPGAGKSTSLLQLADQLHADEVDRVPLLLPLGEFAGDSVFTEILRRRSFANFTPQQLAQLASAGRLVLLCDGWNELSSDQRAAVKAAVELFRRDFPECSLILASRYGRAYPFKLPKLDLAELAEEQQLSIMIDALGPSEGPRLLQRARETNGLKDLVEVPLYLSALARLNPRGELPSTKERLMSALVAEHDAIATSNDRFTRLFRGTHQRVLRDIACSLVMAGTASVSETDLRQEIAHSSDRLKAERQLASDLEPHEAIQALVDHFGLIQNTSVDPPTYAFPHEQFQEWFASFHVAASALEALTNDQARARLLTSYVDRQPWSESVLFAVERMGRSGQANVRAAARLILWTLGVDHAFAARLIGRAGDDVWKVISASIRQHVDEWMQLVSDVNQKRDVVTFLAMCGREELSDRLWDMLERDKQGESLPRRSGVALRTILAADWDARFPTLNTQVRRAILYDIAHEGADGRRIALDAAAKDPASEVLRSVVNIVRHDDPESLNGLSQLSPAAWEVLAKSEGVEELAPGSFAEQLLDEKKRLASASPDIRTRIRMQLQLAALGHQIDHAELVQLALNEPPLKDSSLRSLLGDVAEAAPEEMSKAMLARLLDGQRVPYSGRVAIASFAEVNQPALLDVFSQRLTDRNTIELAAPLLDQKSVATLLSEALAILGKPWDQRNDGGRFEALRAALGAARFDFILQAVTESSTTNPDEIGWLARLLHRTQSGPEGRVPKPTPDQLERIAKLVEVWAPICLSLGEPPRYAMSDVAYAIGRFELNEQLPILVSLLNKDLDTWRQQRADLARDIQARNINRSSSARTSYCAIYRQGFDGLSGDAVKGALLALLDDDQFGTYAAFALQRFADDGIDRGTEAFGHVPYDRLRSRAAQLAEAADCPANAVAGAVIDRIAPALALGTKEGLERAYRFSLAASQMNFGDRIADITAVLDHLPNASNAHDLLEALAMRGIVLEHTKVCAGLELALEEISNLEWRSDNDWWKVRRWLPLVAFSDKPLEALPIIERIPQSSRRPYELEPIVRALGYSAVPTAVSTLRALADLEPDLQGSHSWSEALALQASPEASDVLIDSIFHDRGRSRDDYALERSLISLLRSKRDLIEPLLSRLASSDSRRARHIAAQALEEVLDEALAIRLLELAGSDAGDPLWQALIQGVERVSVEHRPAENGNWVELIPRPVNEFRAALFGHVASNSPHAELARLMLERIDAVRRDYGQPPDERRHPDIQAGVPWPSGAAKAWEAAAGV